MQGGLFVVAGATGAIGKELCRNILRQGGRPLLVGRSHEKLQSVRQELLQQQQGNTKISNEDCRIVSGIDFSVPKDAGTKLSAELKGETIHGIACTYIAEQQT